MRKSFTTLVKNDGNDYMRGFVAGIMHTICGARMSAWIGFENDSRMISVTCSGLQYWIFTRIVNGVYPDLCIFDYKE